MSSKKTTKTKTVKRKKTDGKRKHNISPHNLSLELRLGMNFSLLAHVLTLVLFLLALETKGHSQKIIDETSSLELLSKLIKTHLHSKCTDACWHDTKGQACCGGGTCIFKQNHYYCGWKLFADSINIITLLQKPQCLPIRYQPLTL